MFSLWNYPSSPTVATSVVMIVFAIAAHGNRRAAVVDIGGAFLNATMTTRINVYMRLDRTMSRMMCNIDSMHAKYLDAKWCD